VSQQQYSVLQKDMEPGGFDEALAPLLPLVEADIFGAVAEAKEVAAFAGGLKEAKKQRGYEAYRLLAQGVTFRTHTAFLLSLVGAAASSPPMLVHSLLFGSGSQPGTRRSGEISGRKPCSRWRPPCCKLCISR
jgi:hypothetical protein